MTARFLLASLTVISSCIVIASPQANAAEVIAFWGFADDYNFAADADDEIGPNKQDFAPDAGIRAGSANLQAYLGVAAELDLNGGGGWTTFDSPNGITYEPTRTLKFDDLRGGGDDFDIGGTDAFMVDKLQGAGPESDDFGNDALLYITFDGTGYQDFELRFDIEGTPGDLPASFDIFYRTGGAGTWFRDPTQNNIGLAFQDFAPVDLENQFASTDQIGLASALNGQGQIELIVNDFAELGNGEMELDNIQITGTAIPEPASTAALLAIASVFGIRRRRPIFGS